MWRSCCTLRPWRLGIILLDLVKGVCGLPAVSFFYELVLGIVS